jgi:hypothetical protein
LVQLVEADPPADWQEKKKNCPQPPEHRARAWYAAWQLADKIHDDRARLIDWRFGWPVCVRAFAEDYQRIAKAKVKNHPDWVIHPTSGKLLEIAENIVLLGIHKALGKKLGGDAGADERFPTASFGNLVTVDRKEIESYRSIQNLMQEYMGKAQAARPLSIAVFGPPGSGKSFGVMEIAASIDKARYYALECNLSQFVSRDDLVNAFITARDHAVAGKVPMIFFDEFDGSLDGEPLGWLKYFLSVMQDGKYRFRDQELRLGQTILVFAGGTSQSYQGFARVGATRDELAQFERAKGPDFVSRLRGYVDIIGPNPRPDTPDDVYVIRRAIVLHALLKKHHPRLVENRDEAAIDRNVLRALLKVHGYRHGMRSMEAVLEMSTLARSEKFDKAALPPKEQLAMHLERHPQKPDELYELLEADPSGA